MGIRLSGDLSIRSGLHHARLHGQDSQLTMDFESLGSIRHLQKELPKPIPVGGTPDTDPVTIQVRVKGTLVATATLINGRFMVKRHWLGIIRSLFH